MPEKPPSATDLASVPYSEADWCRNRQQQDIGVVLSCPDCDSGHHFEVYSYAKGDGSARLYRGCKMCGFWQDVDDPPHRCLMTAHWCTRTIPRGQRCSSCDRVAVPDDVLLHTCWRVVRPAELKEEPDEYTCDGCAVTLISDHRIPWPEQPGTELWLGRPYSPDKRSST